MPRTISELVFSEFDKLNAQIRRNERGIRKNINHRVEAPEPRLAKGAFPDNPVITVNHGTSQVNSIKIYGANPNSFPDAEWFLAESFTGGGNGAIHILNKNTIINAAANTIVSSRGVKRRYRVVADGYLEVLDSALNITVKVWAIEGGKNPGAFPEASPKYTETVSGTGTIETNITIESGLWAIVEATAPWGIVYGFFPISVYESVNSSSLLSSIHGDPNDEGNYVGFGRSASNNLTIKTNTTLSNSEIKVWTVKSTPFYTSSSKRRFPIRGTPDHEVTYSSLNNSVSASGIYPSSDRQWGIFEVHRGGHYGWALFRVNTMLTRSTAFVGTYVNGVGYWATLSSGQLSVGSSPNSTSVDVAIYYI